jgi:predicted RNA-binding protein with PIN domain
MIVDRYDLLIDGYNLMHASGHARDRYGPRGLERQRERFLGWLRRHVPASLRSRTIVVFDAGETTNTCVEQASYEELRLLFSPQRVEADDLIEELIEIHSAPKRLQVVSSDHRLHKAARKRKATCLDSEEFISMLARLAREEVARRQAEEELAKPQGELPEQTAEWLEVFADAQTLIDADPLTPPSRNRKKPTSVKSASKPPEPVTRKKREKSAGAEPVEQSCRTRSAGLAADELAFWEERLRDLLEPPRRP